jgi:hypothetical protein
LSKASTGLVTLAPTGAWWRLGLWSPPVVGGFLIKRALVLVEVAAPRVVSFLAQGGKGAVRWFRNLLVRASPEDRELLRQLWMKAEAQGLNSLTVAERQKLSAVMGRMEKLLDTPLDDGAKRELRRWSRQEYFELHNPQFAELLGVERMKFYQVHHIRPMEFAHLFPKLDINGKANLVRVHVDVHLGINAVWKSLGDTAKRMKPKDVERVVEIVNRHYSRWFEKVFDPKKDAAMLLNAKQAALREVAELKGLLAP